MTKTGGSARVLAVALFLNFAAIAAFADKASNDESEKAANQMMVGGNVPGAKNLLEKLVANAPQIARYKSSLARCYIAMGDLSKALALASEAIALDPDDTNAHIERGNIFVTRHDYPQAMKDYQKVVALQPNNRDGLLGRAIVNNLTGNFALAKKDLDRVSVLDPTSPDLQRTLIFYYSNNGSFDECIKQCSIALKYLPTDANIYMVRGRHYAAKGQFKEALKDFHRAESLDLQDKPELYAAMAGAYQFLGQTEACLSYLDKCLALAPNKVNALGLRGTLEFQKGNFARAQSDSEKALKISPADLLAVNTIIRCYARQGRNLDIVKITSAAIAVEPKSEFFLLRADALKQLGRLSEAEKDCSLVISRDGKNARAFSMRAQIQFAAGNTREALVNAEKALSLNPDNVVAKNVRTRCLQAIDPSRDYKMTAGGNEKNPLLLDAAVRRNPADADALVRRGNYYLKSLESERAIVDYTAAIKISPRLAGAFVHRGMAYRAIRQYDKALADFEQALRLDPSDEQAYLESARLNVLLKRPADALANYNELFKLQPSSDLYLERGALFLSLHKLQPALEDADKALSMVRKAEHYKFKADVLMALGRYREAADDYSEAIKRAPTSGGLYRARKTAYDKLGENELAAADQKSSQKFDAEIFENAPFAKH